MNNKNSVLYTCLGLVLGLVLVIGASTGAFAVSEHVKDNGALATDGGASVINGNSDATNAGTNEDMTPGDLKLAYTKTNGDSVTSSGEGTQFTTVVEDTVLKTPADSMLIDIYVDADVTNKSGIVYGDQKVHSGGDGADTASSHPAFIERGDTAVFRLRLMNTGNGSETITFTVLNWDTNPNIAGDPNASAWTQQAAEGASAVVANFHVSLTDQASLTTGMADSLTAPIGSVLTAVGSYPAFISLGTTALAEGAETAVLLRVASLTTSAAFDTIGITVMSSPDSHGAAYVAGQYARISHDSGYIGDNDTNYAQGSSMDSVSVFVTVATAVVRIKKTDTVTAPTSYATVTTGAGTTDVVPGSSIIYTIVYDNDGNRQADSVAIIDVLPSNVDLKVGAFINGVDTGLAHVRGNGTTASNGWDTGVVVNFSDRSDSVNFNDTSTITFSNAAYNGTVCDSVAAVKITFFDRTSGQAYPESALAVDNKNATDTLGDVNGPGLDSNGTGGDSLDVGMIRIAVVVR